MKFGTAILVGAFLCVSGHQSAFAQRMGMGAPASPQSSVEGRTYCQVVEIVLMRSPSATASAPASLSTVVVRRESTFSGGTLETDLISRTVNSQDADTGAVTQNISAGLPLTGSYVQTQNNLNMVLVFPNFQITTTWYVSKDGSVINGTLSSQRSAVTIPPDEFDFVAKRNWTLVESDTCEEEGFITEL